MNAISLAKPDAASALYVLFRLGEGTYAIAASLVVQMETFTSATPVPGAPPFVSGLVQVRGRVVPVVDLRILLGAPLPADISNQRIIVGQVGERIVALLVDSAREVVLIAPNEIGPPSPITARGDHNYVTGVVARGERLVMLVNFSSLIGEERLDVD